MKNIKRIFAFVIVLVMMAVLGVTAQAVGNYTITISNSASGHYYDVYQVFTGTLSGEGTTASPYILTNVQWGSGVNGSALLTALKADATVGTRFTNCSTAADAAKAMDGITDNSTDAMAIAQVIGSNLSTTIAGTGSYSAANSNYTITGLDAGYYFVKDRNGTQSGYDSYTGYILEVVSNVTVNPKSSKPSVEKKVLEESYAADDGYGTGYNDVADYDIGDAVPFELIGTLPSNYADYTTYAYTFHDTQSAGLSFNSSSVSVVVVNGTETTTVAASNYTVVTSGLTDDCAFEVRFSNLKSVSGVISTSKIIVYYTAALNSSAVIGLDGNPNQVYLTYSNNPNTGYETNTGTTPVDAVIVFTYKLDVTKIDGDTANETTPTVLPGASFILYRAVVSGENTTNYYAQVTNGRLTGWTTTEADATTLTTYANGLVSVAGLDDGTYYIEETAAPAGYNRLSDPVELTIAATTANGQSWTSNIASDALTALTIAVGNETATAGSAATGAVATTVANNTGATLPSTGGIGTTIFYIVGGLLMAAAVVLLVTKKKMSAHQD